MSLNFIDKAFTIGGEGTPTLLFYKRGFLLGGSGTPTWQDIILSGTTALTLVNAKADGLNYVKIFGATEQDSTEYLNTVTLIGGTEQTNLPSGYTQLKYVQNNTSATNVNTGVIPEIGDVLEIRFTTPYSETTSNYLLQSRESNNAGIYGISGSLTGNTIILSWGSGNSVTSNIIRELNHEYIIKASIIGTTLTLYVKDVTAGTEDTVTKTITASSDTTAPYFIWGNGFQDLSQTTPVYYARITNNGVTKLNYVPAKDSNDLASFYDLLNDTFITNFNGTITGSTDVATPTPDTPINLVSNNGVIKVSPNLFDISKAVRGDIASATGDISTTVLYRLVSDFIPVSAGQSYTASGKICFEGDTDEYDIRLIIAFYNSSKGYISGSRTTSPLGFTIPDNGASYIRVEYWGNLSSGYTVDTDRSKLQFELGTTATAYMPYGEIYTDGTQEVVTDNLGNTADAEMLLSLDIGTKDEQEILTGNITRNIGIKVLDGSEDWSVNTGTYQFYRLNSAVQNATDGFTEENLRTSHFPVGATISGANNNQGLRIYNNSFFLRCDDLYTATDENLPLFKQWLANQYVNGKPVIVIYKLTTPTTETVTGQILEEQPITQTAGSILNLPITVETGTNPTPTHPKDIICNNGVLKANAQGQIYTDGTTETVTDSLGNTATAEMLLAIDNFKDIQSVLDGTITRNIGIKVLDGTEGWRKGTSFFTDLSLNALESPHSCICNYYVGKNTEPYVGDSNTIQVGYSASDFTYWNRVYITANREEYATAQDFANYLADQYNAGHPVIVIYPLKTPITETVTGQTLTTQVGTNTITATGAIEDLELEVSYKAGVSVTITEIQNANLDNSVAITIGE